MENLNKATIPLHVIQPPEKKEGGLFKPNVLAIILFLILGIVTAKVTFQYLLPIITKNLKNKKTLERQSLTTSIPNKPTSNINKQTQQMATQATKTINNLIQTATKSKTQQPASNTFSLNGIFFSEVETKGTALINNKIVQEGDIIENAKVIKISADTVELDLEGQTIKLVNR